MAQLDLREREMAIPAFWVVFDGASEADLGGAAMQVGLASMSGGAAEAQQLGVEDPEVVVADG